MSSIEPDLPLYTSGLGTPVYCDLTFGDPTNPNFNVIIGDAGKSWPFNPVRFAIVLMKINQGILQGGNGFYLRDDVANFKRLSEIQLPLQVTSRGLQMFDIHFWVFTGFDFPQLSGEQSQEFSSL